MYENRLLNRLESFYAETSELLELLDKNFRSQALSNQLARSASAPLLIYSEAIATATDKDYANKVRMALKEMRESVSTLKLVRASSPVLTDRCNKLIDEAEQLAAILYTCCRKAENKAKNMNR